MNSLTQKHCYKCGEWKDFSEFHKDKYTRDGYQAKCKACSSSRVRISFWQELKQNPGMKRCSKCGELKQLSQFHKDKDKKDGFATQCKACKCAVTEEWYRNNPQRAYENSKTWQANNREKSRAQKKKSSLVWRLKYPDRAKASKRAAREKHAEEVRAYRQSYKLSHPGYSTARSQTRRARVAGADGNGWTAKQAEEIKRAYGYVCAYCGKKFKSSELTLDHIKPLVNGGAHDIDNNIAPACKSCNSRKGIKSLLNFLYDVLNWERKGRK